ncbi:AAA family ATPase [Bradyrhizobium sp. RDM4]|uniref:AAA family ATPase n=1 Tax=Bradyrhizobium sp. RDM4 TaxID=3378765 RepID=UPI0038FD1EBA
MPLTDASHSTIPAETADLGRFDEGVRLWSRMIATASPEMRPTIFRNCIAEGAVFVRKGAPRGLIVAELIERAGRHRLLDALGGVESVEKLVADGLDADARQTSNGQDTGSAAPPAIVATPFRWRDPSKIPARKWLYGRHYARQFLTCTIASSGMGKTSLAISEALAMASGKALLGITPPERARVWLWNGEDPRDEIDRRIVAGMLEHGLQPTDVEGYLFTDVGREMPVIIATQTRYGAIIAKPVVEAVIATIQQNRIDVLVVDPFIKSHKVAENDNSAMDAVATEWAHIADKTNCAIELLHHTRKTGGADVSVEDGRGAGAVVSASRSARAVNRMSKEEAVKAGIDATSAWRYLKVDSGKASMSSHPEHADWYRLVTVPLGNGDDVGVVVNWSWPDAFAGVTVHDLRAAQKAVNEGGPWRANHQAKAWVGKPIASALKLNVRAEADRQKIRTMLGKWIENGMFVAVKGKGDDRHPTTFVEVGTWAND